jgi:hypothetical protein
MIYDTLRHDVETLENPHATQVSEAVFERVDRCFNAQVGGGRNSALTAAWRFMFWVDQSMHQGGNVDPAAEAQRGFACEYPELAVHLQPDDWLAAIGARRDIGKRGKANPWGRLAAILSKTGLWPKGHDGANLKKTCVGLRNAPGRVLGEQRWKTNRK